jgi:hypothetical protein
MSRTRPAFSCPSVYGSSTSTLSALALGDVQVGAAQTGGADFSQYVQGPDTVGSARSSIVGRC